MIEWAGLRYFVISPDGSKYGPADINMLRAWVVEGRITPDTILEEEQSHQRVAARLVAGLSFGGEAPSMIPPGGQQRGYGRPEFSKKSDDGNSDVLWSYVCSAMTIICCCLFNIAGFVYANRAISKGNRRGHGARIFAVIMLVLWIITTIITIPFLNQLKDMVMKMVDQGGAQ